jgi:Zn-dependent oligopeptidase
MDSDTRVTAALIVSRRTAMVALIASSPVLAQTQDPQQEPHERQGFPPNSDDRKLPNGKSQSDAIAKEDHQKALKDAEDLVAMAEQLRDELKRAGDYVVPVSSVKKTEEIEKLARKIRGRLRD